MWAFYTGTPPLTPRVRVWLWPETHDESYFASTTLVLYLLSELLGNIQCLFSNYLEAKLWNTWVVEMRIIAPLCPRNFICTMQADFHLLTCTVWQAKVSVWSSGDVLSWESICASCFVYFSPLLHLISFQLSRNLSINFIVILEKKSLLHEEGSEGVVLFSSMWLLCKCNRGIIQGRNQWLWLLFGIGWLISPWCRDRSPQRKAISWESFRWGLPQTTRWVYWTSTSEAPASTILIEPPSSHISWFPYCASSAHPESMTFILKHIVRMMHESKSSPQELILEGLRCFIYIPPHGVLGNVLTSFLLYPASYNEGQYFVLAVLFWRLLDKVPCYLC